MSKTTNSTNQDTQRKIQMDKKALISKLQGIRSHQEALIQKKLRIDLEIKKTQQRIRKLQQRAKSVTQATNAFVSETASSPLPETYLAFLQEASSEERQDLELLLEIAATDRIEPLYQEIENRLYVPEIG